MSVPSCLSRRKGHVCNLTRYVAKRLAPCDSTYEIQSRVPYLTAHQALGHPWPASRYIRSAITCVDRLSIRGTLYVTE